MKNEQKKGSDLDILVDFEEPVDLWTFVDLQSFLSKRLKVKVDLVMKSALRPYREGNLTGSGLCMREIRDYLMDIKSKTTNLTFEEFIGNEDLKKAFVRSLEVIGEACKHRQDSPTLRDYKRNP